MLISFNRTYQPLKSFSGRSPSKAIVLIWRYKDSPVFRLLAYLGLFFDFGVSNFKFLLLCLRNIKWDKHEAIRIFLVIYGWQTEQNNIQVVNSWTPK